MNEKKQDEELQSRREFFKETSKKVLPLIALVTVGSTFLSACEKESTASTNRGRSSGCNDGCSRSCSGSCDDSCSGSCETSCARGCSYNCKGGTRSY